MLKLILQGKKTQTRRTKQLREWKVGNAYPLTDRRFGSSKGYVRITRKWRERLGVISGEDVLREGFESRRLFKSWWIANVGPWEPNQIVTCYEFVRVVYLGVIVTDRSAVPKAESSESSQSYTHPCDIDEHECMKTLVMDGPQEKAAPRDETRPIIPKAESSLK